jgi:hypothetical protein
MEEVEDELVEVEISVDGDDEVKLPLLDDQIEEDNYVSTLRPSQILTNQEPS